MRALIVTNMWPSPAAPALGSFVRDQVDALRRAGGETLELEVFAFPPGGYASAARALRGLDRSRPFDVVHAHFGLSAWPALAAPARARAVTLHGTDLRHPRTRVLTRLVLPRIDLVATVSEQLSRELPERVRSRAAVLPCGVAIDRFRPTPRSEARAELGLDPDGRYLLFPSDPARPGKRHDLAAEVAAACEATLLVLRDVPPERAPLYVNAAAAVVMPSEREGFGDLEGKALELLRGAVPVGKAGRVAEIQEVLVRELDEQLVQDREPAHAGVEDRDRPPARITRSVRHGVSIRTPAEGAGRASAVTCRASRPRSRPSADRPPSGRCRRP